jgi:hypothetical protein
MARTSALQQVATSPPLSLEVSGRPRETRALMPVRWLGWGLVVQAFLGERSGSLGFGRCNPKVAAGYLACKSAHVLSGIRTLCSLNYRGKKHMYWDEQTGVFYFSGSLEAKPPRTRNAWLQRKRYVDALPDCPVKALILEDLALVEPRAAAAPSLDMEA